MRATIVVDRADGNVLPGTSVFNCHGIIIGIADDNGMLPRCGHDDYPLTVRSLGFNDRVIEEPCDTIALEPAVYELGDVTVLSGERPVMRVTCYIREFATGATVSDTTRYYAQHMGYIYFPVGDTKKFKAKLKPHLALTAVTKRVTSSEGTESISHSSESDMMFSWISLFEVKEKTTVGDSILQGNATWSEMGKHSRRTIQRVTDGTLLESTDALANFNNHTFSPGIFKLLGIAMDLTELRHTWLYAKDARLEQYGPESLALGSLSLEINAKGKFFKKAFKTDNPVLLRGYYEIYPVDRQYYTVDEAKAEIKEKPTLTDFTMLTTVNALPPGFEFVEAIGE